MDEIFYGPVDPQHIKNEKAKARTLRESNWWKQKLATGTCHYCGQKVPRSAMTMDHILPIGRGGHSTKGNIVPSCKTCNTKKSHQTPFEMALHSLREKS